MILEFKSDKKLRDKWFVPEHFSHPAKMMLLSFEDVLVFEKGRD
jgi:hypothetical protein